MRVGATYLGDDRCEFTVWAPHCSTVAVKLLADPEAHLVSLQRDSQGYWHGVATQVPVGTRYGYLLNDEKIYPDPASHFQPEGVHHLSAIVDHQAFPWTDEGWQNPPLRDYVIYEIHVGTFTPEGTFDAIIPRLPRLVELGIRALEIMPVAQFPGHCNWGYDGVYPYAVQNSYGGSEGLKRLVNACHQQGLAVILDVVYNHLGPEGNYTTQFAPYFTDKYHTPWGKAMNYDDRFSGGVRNFVIQNALHWLRDYHIDALRLDAIQTIYDCSAHPILEELSATVKHWAQHQGRSIYLIAETDNNDARILRPQAQGGTGLDAQWSDDFHHALHGVLTGETHGYFQDFGQIEALAQCLRDGFTYTGQFSAFRQCHRGNSAHDRPLEQFVVCLQNHDQVGNRINGERLHHLIRFETQKLAVATLLLSPYVPLLFMGEEYGDPHPFLYFVDHSDPTLVKAVHRGRKQEFAALHLKGDPPFVGDRETFLKSQLEWDLQFHSGTEPPEHSQPSLLWNFYRHLLQLRLTLRPQARPDLQVDLQEPEQMLMLQYQSPHQRSLIALNFDPQPQTWHSPLPPGSWKKIFDSAEPQWSFQEQDQVLAPQKIQGETEVLMLQGHNAVVYGLPRSSRE
ncbi:MAG: malto-oligosyltrehalose trehalohydrolase [Prochlorotrichaceae cyanobacterium]|jgi:maltooligosyltrehalose trehalohydrolase